ncbi:MAG: hypothetical protein P4L55_16260 [Syntrophobacteraceae bacterium]|nr:hypothetical protein [Syntrophobacteraceae bacterium]
MGLTAAERLKSQGRHVDLVRTHIADIPPNVQNLLADEFERKVITLHTLHAKLEAKYAEVNKDKKRLTALNRRQSVQIDNLKTALEETCSRVVEQSRRIARLENEIASERDSHQRGEKANSECADESAKVWHKLDDCHP